MTFRKKLLLLLVGLSLLAAVILDVAGSAVLRASLRSLAAKRLENESALLAEVLASPPTEAPAALQKRVESMGLALAVRVTLVDASGTVLADSEVLAQDVPGLENHLGRPEIQQALVQGTGHSRRYSKTLHMGMSYFARLVRFADGRRGFVRLAVPTSTLEEGGGSLRAAVGAIAFLAFLALGGLSYAATRRFSQPLERIARSADAVASGSYDTTIRYHEGAAEVRALGLSLERMRLAMLGQIGALEEDRRLLRMVLSGMREGLLAVDEALRVIVANSAYKRAYGLEEMSLKGRSLAEVLRDPTAADAFKRAVHHSEESRVLVHVQFPAHLEFELLVAPLGGSAGAHGAIGIFLDVTRLHAVERMRREFITDLSHEMRTPLSSLRAAIENLTAPSAVEPADRDRFLGIMARNLERIQALIDDLTDLSLVETGAITLERESLSVAGVVRDVEESLKSAAERRGVTVTRDVPSGLRVTADRRRLDQILMNVVDNAIKFNKPGGSVQIRAENKPEGIVISVDDTGRGVPPEDLERIFQRFYRVDRGRSRQEGGSGLGLAIVKHLMRLHGGSASAELAPGGGLRMLLHFRAELGLLRENVAS